MLYNHTEKLCSAAVASDGAAHGKKSILDRIRKRCGKFANLRAYYGWMRAFPLKPPFMGNEFACGRVELMTPASTGTCWRGAITGTTGFRLVRDLNHTPIATHIKRCMS